MKSLVEYERKAWSQHGEDGIIQALTDSLKTRNNRFVEIGAHWEECNSRALIERGWTGRVYDMMPEVRQFPNGEQRKVTPRTVPDVESEPDFFSLDIDSYDYFVLDAMLRKGFRPKVICVEFNSFIPDTLTVCYQEQFSRYHLHPGYGLYFGAGLEAWKHLLRDWRFAQDENISSAFHWRFVGCESSFTNAFFVRTDQSDWPESNDFGYQTYFCKKYGKSGPDLRAELLKNSYFLDVRTSEYEHAFEEATGSMATRIEVATTFRADDYGRFARRAISTFRDCWPQSIDLHYYEHPYLLAHAQESQVSNVVAYDYEEETRFKEFIAAHGEKGRLGPYNYIYDAPRWSHRIFALAARARESQASILINFDADIITHTPIPEGFLEGLLGDADIAYMPRPGMYSECSFVLYRLSNPLVREFIEEHEKMYLSGLIFNIKEGWTDCHAFDVLLRVYRRHGLITTNINEGLPQSMHPFVNGPLGRYMDHLKGQRKKEGRSRQQDLVVPRTEAYWQEKEVARDSRVSAASD